MGRDCYLPSRAGRRPLGKPEWHGLRSEPSGEHSVSHLAVVGLDIYRVPSLESGGALGQSFTMPLYRPRRTIPLVQAGGRYG